MSYLVDVKVTFNYDRGDVSSRYDRGDEVHTVN